MNITISVSSDLHSHVTKAGFATIDAYVQHLIDEDLTSHHQIATTKAPPSESFTAWKQELDEFLKLLQPGNPHMDDSREAIYSERFNQLSPHADSP